MECKFNFSDRFVQFKNELIDTLWNVNTAFIANGETGIVELIDTLWNVNDKRCKAG